MTNSSASSEDEAAPLLRWYIRDGDLPPLTDMRQAVADALPDVAEDTVVDVKLICTELVTNVHQHAYSDGELRITRPTDGVICVEVEDGSPRPPRVGPNRHRDRTARRCQGWQVVDALAEQWGVRPAGRGKTVWIEIQEQALAA